MPQRLPARPDTTVRPTRPAPRSPRRSPLAPDRATQGGGARGIRRLASPNRGRQAGHMAMKKPGPVVRWFYRVPTYLFRARLGRLLGPGLVMITTTGRTTGATRRVVVEVV